jgi:HAD superfamily phosphatase (TIGR01668 family)
MSRKFRPDFSLDSILDVDDAFLKDNNIDGLIIDIDNTIAVTCKKTTDTRIREHLFKLRDSGIKIFLLSNASLSRVTGYDLKDEFPLKYSAKKPLLKNYRYALETLDTDKTRTAMIGDQILTDIYGGNRMGLVTILVEPIHLSNENLFIKFKRLVENYLMK